jgi:hypothetical protein
METSPSSLGNSGSSAHLLTWRDGGLAALVAILSLALYIRTLAPSLLVGDSAEFQVLAAQVGIAHTPGYPVYMLVAKLFTLLPVGDIAYRVNLCSAALAALAIAGVYVAAKLLAGSRAAAVSGALALAVSLTLWSQALIAEVYTAGAACAAWVLAGLLGWYRTGARAPLFLAGLLGGLSLGVHSTVALLAPAVLLFLWLNRARWPRFWASAAGGALAGVLLYLSAFVAVEINAPPANIFNAAYGPAHSAWGLTSADVASPLGRMIFVGSGAQWRSAMLAGWGELPRRLAGYLLGLPREFGWLALALIGVGTVALFRRERALAWALLLALLLQWVFAFTYLISDFYIFYLTSYLILALIAAYGAARAVDWLARRAARQVTLIRAAALAALLALGVWPVLAQRWPAVHAGSVPFANIPTYPVNSDTETTTRIARRVTEQLPPNAIVFIDWNRLYAYYYAAQIEQHRADLRFIEAAPRSDRFGLPASTIEFIRANIATHPILFFQPYVEVEQAGFSFRTREIWFSTFYQVEQQ